MGMLTRLLLPFALVLLLLGNNRVLAQGGSVADGSGAKLRAEATRKGPVLAVLPTGTPVKVYQTKNGYARVSAAGKKGWVAQRLLIRHRNVKTPLSRTVAPPSPARRGAHARGPAGGKGTSRGGKQACTVSPAPARKRFLVEGRAAQAAQLPPVRK